MRGLIDMHCHIVPGVDDGAGSLEEAARLLQMEYRNGVREIIATPHYRKGMFEASQARVNRQYVKLERMVRGSRTGMRVHLGCEFHTGSEMVKQLCEGKRPTMAGSGYVLTEFSSVHGYAVLRNQIYDLVAAGFVPIVAHAERYPCLLKKPELIRELKELGAEIQITSGSVLGDNGFRIKLFCKKLLREHQVQYIASDAHNLQGRRPDLGECAVYLERKFGTRYMEQLLIRNPRKIIVKGKENR